MRTEIISMEKAILHLHNLGLELNELRSDSEYIHINRYEDLLNWAIEAITVIKDSMSLK
jgi:hypothetical protein